MSGAAKKKLNSGGGNTSNSGRGTTSRGHNDDGSGVSSSSGKATGSAKTRSPSGSNRGGNVAGGFDGNRDPSDDRAIIKVENKNIDLGARGSRAARGLNMSMTFPKRPAPSTLGQPCKIGLNTFNVESFPSAAVYQFDVLVGNGTEKRGLVMKVWESKAVQSKIGKGYIFDGNKLAWGLKDMSNEIRIVVDMDAEQGRTPQAGKEDKNKFTFTMRRTNKVRFEVLDAYLHGRADFDNSCLEAINFMDHMLREYPRGKYTQIKRSFFARGEGRFVLGNAVEAFKGVYQSMRIVNAGVNSPARLSINLDVANGTFWTESMVHQAAQNLCNARDIPHLINGLRDGEKGRMGLELKKLRKLHVTCKHRGKDTIDEYCIEKLIWQTADQYKIEVEGSFVPLTQFYAKKYMINIHWPHLPLLKMTKGKNTVIPMELCQIKINQRYLYKLDEKQTSNMIKFAVTPPPVRWQAIEHGLRMLDWGTDPVLRHFGTRISPNRSNVDGRLLVAPTVKFGRGDAKPGTSGRWDLKGKQFLTTNTKPLKSWGVCVIRDSRRGMKPDKTTIDNFIREFIKTYISHGGRIENKNPKMQLAEGSDAGQWVASIWNATGSAYNARPEILFFVMPAKDANMYGKIKRSCDCRYGVVSQCVQYQHAQRAQGQYLSNVCMKVNAKLGGQTSRAVGPKTMNGHFTKPTCILGADVSHAAPGQQTPSMAALTCSMDNLGIRYAGACETNGFRQEMIMKQNIQSMLMPLLQAWVGTCGGKKWPERIIYFRDGVSEGQYSHVLDQEVKDMKSCIRSSDAQKDIPMVVIVSSKRHHVRFFPQQGDRNGNPLPGTLVESGVTNPYENDFYLNSHAAIKGTARPMHYHVLLNECNMSNDELQTLIYEQCYQYIRATTPVSQHPAIYYAHIVSNRAIPHERAWMGSTNGAPPVPKPTDKKASGSGSKGGQDKKRGETSYPVGEEAEKLMPMPNDGGIRTAMWFI